MPDESVKKKVQEKLKEQSSISGADIAEMTSAPEQEPEEETVEKTEVLPSSEDVVADQAGKDQPYEVLDNAMEQSDKFEGNHLGLMEMDEVEISEIDKVKFLDCLVDGKRFTREFSLFGGRITGTFRSRTTKETSAILGELGRRTKMNKGLSTVEYASMLRHATLAFQIDEMDGTAYPVPGEPLRATYNDDTAQVEDPSWWKRAKVYEEMPEGTEQALYSALLDFERVYWTMIKKAQDQNFWNPGGSTTG